MITVFFWDNSIFNTDGTYIWKAGAEKVGVYHQRVNPNVFIGDDDSYLVCNFRTGEPVATPDYLVFDRLGDALREAIRLDKEGV
jgi:hypothetical protein